MGSAHRIGWLYLHTAIPSFCRVNCTVFWRDWSHLSLVAAPEAFAYTGGDAA